MLLLKQSLKQKVMLCKRGSLKNFADFTFPVKFVKYLRMPFFTEYHRWLLLMQLSEMDFTKKTMILSFCLAELILRPIIPATI